jgi:hypothetical protein
MQVIDMGSGTEGDRQLDIYPLLDFLTKKY